MSTPIPLYILAGGHSSRFGGDKALADLGGRPMILRVAEQWAPRTARVCVVAERPERYAALGLRTIADRTSGQGPIGGLARALEDCGGGWMILAGCDALLLDLELPARLLAGIGDGVRVVAMRGERWEPMPALYHSAMLPEVEAAMAAGQRALWRVIEAVPHRAIEVASLAQINTREELAAYATRKDKPVR